MPRPEEDQPNCELPATAPFHSEGQFWRVRVNAPDTRLLLGQRVLASPLHGHVFGYPGATLTTRASFFADVHERTVWQGRDVIAFQSPANTELHSGHAVVLGATPWGDQFEPDAGERLGRTRAQSRLYGQLRDHTIGYYSYNIARTTLGIAKSVLSLPLVPLDAPKVLVQSGLKSAASAAGGTAGAGLKAAPKVAGITAALAGLGSASAALKALTPAEVEPGPGLHLTSDKGVFVGSTGSTCVLAAQGFNVLSGVGVSLHGAATMSLSAGLSTDIFALATVSMSALWSAEVGALRNSSLIAKAGTAAVLGKTVKLGSQLPGEEAVSLAVPGWVPKAGGTMLNRRSPTESVSIEALKSIEAKVGGKFSIDAPVGEVTSTSRKASVEAVESVTLKTPFGKVEITATGISVAGAAANIKVTAMNVEITGGAAKVVVGPAGVTVRSPGAQVNVMPGGVVAVQGTMVKLG
ncbi:MAG: hypothetical protein U0325_29155 [Polyangiales bacterium]